jgi:spore photoproduct lyase
MPDQLRQSELASSERDKYRQAALKAWVTIKRKRREAASRGVKRIEEFASARVMGSLGHPEMLLLKETEEESFGKGLVKLFQKTPEDIVCGKFWEVRWAFGCPFDCNYCYLRGTMKGRMRPSFVKVELVLSALDEAFSQIKTPSLFNSGELSDSLMNPLLMSKVADKFETQDKHKLVTLSKFGPKAVGFLLERPRKQVICAWSINATEVARRWERAAASPEKRIEAAALVSEAGYDTRVRIDPIFPIANWRTHYEDLLHAIFSAFEPKRIILGTPRGLWKTIKYANAAGLDMSWTKYFQEDSGWGKKLQFESRLEVYSWFYNKLSDMGFSTNKISMCKETRAMWDTMKLDYVPLTCQCYGPRASVVS